MENKIDAAKTLLQCKSVMLTAVNVKAAFQNRVRQGHPDKGGQSDVGELIQARDFLLSHLPRLLPTCSVKLCMEAPTRESKKCSFHKQFT